VLPSERTTSGRYGTETVAVSPVAEMLNVPAAVLAVYA
jgi:hypothetical protein